MKVLIATSDYDDRILALLEFKKLNVAHSIDFVSSEDELVEYLNSKMNGTSDLPNLLLINSNIQTKVGVDPLSAIKSNSAWKELDVVVFSTFSNLRKIIIWKEGRPEIRTTDPDELVWILREICNGLTTKVGWQYQIRSAARNNGTYFDPVK